MWGWTVTSSKIATKTVFDSNLLYHVEAHDMCDTPDDEDEDEDSDSDTLDTEKELKKINETCQEHSSSNMVDICYISKDVDTIPGERVLNSTLF